LYSNFNLRTGLCSNVHLEEILGIVTKCSLNEDTQTFFTNLIRRSICSCNCDETTTKLITFHTVEIWAEYQTASVQNLTMQVAAVNSKSSIHVKCSRKHSNLCDKKSGAWISTNRHLKYTILSGIEYPSSSLSPSLEWLSYPKLKCNSVPVFHICNACILTNYFHGTGCFLRSLCFPR